MSSLRIAATTAAALAAAGVLTAAIPEPYQATPVAARAAEPAAAARVGLGSRAVADRVDAPTVAKPVARRAAKKQAPAAPAAPKQPVRRVRWDGRAFATPEDAMRFLVAAYNGHDDDAIERVTTPAARAMLLPMRDYAPALRLKTCSRVEDGAYECAFSHSTRRSTKQSGFATFRVAPAAKPGWYMTVLVDCGD